MSQDPSTSNLGRRDPSENPPSSNSCSRDQNRARNFRQWAPRRTRPSRGRARVLSDNTRTNVGQPPPTTVEIDSELEQNLGSSTSENANHKLGRSHGGRHFQPRKHLPQAATSNQRLDDESATNQEYAQRPQSTGYRRGRGRVSRNRLEYRNNNAMMSLDNHHPNGPIGANLVQSEIAESQLSCNDFECMICCDDIARASPIWYCPSCYNIFHLKCSIEWCDKSIKSRNSTTENSYPSLSSESQARNRIEETGSSGSARNNDNNNLIESSRAPVEWPCPACREVLYKRPNKYLCFCGKVVRPEVNVHLTPHSCGQLCGKRRSNQNCPHACNAICHPGKCLPCTLTSKRSCFCGKVESEVKCSSETLGCDQICDKPLLCGTHRCPRPCHPGPCKVCDLYLNLECYCGSQVTQQLCMNTTKKNNEPQLNFSCNRTCDKLLDCGKHRCEKRCHPGPDCPSCRLLSKNIRSCPCGSSAIKKSLLENRESCTDPIPTCESKCNRPLICGPEKNHHRCQRRCHSGTCPPCKLKSTVHCECRLSTRTIECSNMFEIISKDDARPQFRQVSFTFRCEARCNKLKSCGRHRCYNKCCQYLKGLGSHLCDQICGKKLACGTHSCPEICHPGQCGDCTNIGWEELKCHCGSSIIYPPIPCGALVPNCNKPCRRPHHCGHPVRHECHPDSEKCAPCIVFVKKSCFCGADSKDSVYCYLSGYSCGKVCKKQLACGQHTCARVCHDNDCESTDRNGPLLCGRPCPRIRQSCKHVCGLPCHGSAPCPVSDCKEAVKIYCECGNKSELINCHKITRDEDNRNKIAVMCTNRSSQQDATFMIDLSKKQSTKLEDSKESQTKKLDCDETCSILKRNKALAEALDIAQPDLKPTSIFGEDPLKLLKEAVAKDYRFVSATHESLSRFIKTARESERRFTFMQFPPTNKLRREIIHELAHHFNCTSESRDEEPFRHVVVRAYKNKSTIPDFNIEQLLPIED